MAGVMGLPNLVSELIKFAISDNYLLIFRFHTVVNFKLINFIKSD